MKVLMPLSEQEREKLRLLARNVLFDYTDEEAVPREKVVQLAELAVRSFLKVPE